jgi:hypothetical protein
MPQRMRCTLQPDVADLAHELFAERVGCGTERFIIQCERTMTPHDRD